MTAIKFILLFNWAVMACHFVPHAMAQPTPVSPDVRRTTALPVEEFGSLPEVKTMRLSPDGNKLAMISPVNGRNAMVIWDLTGKSKPKAIATGELEPEWLVWKTDKRLLAGLRYFSIRDVRHPTVDTRMVAFDADGGNQISIAGNEWFEFKVPQFQDRIVSLLANDADHILIELPAIERSRLKSEKLSSTSVFLGSQDDKLRYPEIVKVDVNTGGMSLVAHQQGNVVGWGADSAGNIRLGKILDGNKQSYQVRNPANDTWRTLRPFEINKGRVFYVVAFVDDDPNRLIVLSNHEGLEALYEFDVSREAFIRTIARDKNSPVEPIARDGHLLGYYLPNVGAPVYLDAGYANDARVINAALPDSISRIVDRSADGKRVLIRVVRGNAPSAYWLLDRRGDNPALGPVMETYPVLASYSVSNSNLVNYRARDGLMIPALMTLPPGVNIPPRSPISFVVLPHGGPTSRDVPGFDYLVQFLVNRGYGVLQPQFRGSSGLGASFETAGYQQWGLAMQDDVTDGTRWLIQQKYADAERVAIVGSGYGGYAALMGVAKEPGLYRCAVAIAPITDMELLIEHLNHYLFTDLNVPRIGTDGALLRKTSPSHSAGRIQVPLLLVHGRKDYTVPVAHTEIMEASLRKAGKSAEVIYLKDADHYLSRGNDRMAVLKAMGEFLEVNLSSLRGQ